ncbi:hypothetical protein FS749_002678 [Ceratobasidium sp. UAMH 11750]|nr:hypothetical protein FS749_002678 [Ceratobasidium sp. UAMH 11750]
MTGLCSLLLLSLLGATVLAQTPPPRATTGQPCDQARNRLNAETKRFSSDCDDQNYCAADGTCKLKGCRRDEFPFGYRDPNTFPPMCPSGQFCPDEGDQCLDIMPLSSTCQLNRDDQCAPPPDSTGLESEMTNHGAMCFQFSCQYANITLGQPCLVENTVYIGYSGGGQQNINIVSRDRCAVGLWCNAQTSVCEPTVSLGQSCSAHKQCDTYTCGTENVCTVPPGTPLQIQLWQYIVTGIAIVLIMVGTSIGLFKMHTRSRAKKLREIREYFREQTGFRNSIITMHSNARSRISMYSLASSSGHSRTDSLAQLGGALGTRESFEEDDNDRHGLLAGRPSTDTHHDSDDEGVGHIYERGTGVGGSVPLNRPISRLRDEWNPGEWGARK